MKPKRTDNKYWTVARNFNYIQYESDLEDYMIDLENENQRLRLGAVTNRFYAVFSDYGHDLAQKSIWFADPQKAIDFKNDKINAKGKYIILEKSGENGL